MASPRKEWRVSSALKKVMILGRRDNRENWVTKIATSFDAVDENHLV
jgi:hypothetical protein